MSRQTYLTNGVLPIRSTGKVINIKTTKSLQDLVAGYSYIASLEESFKKSVERFELKDIKCFVYQGYCGSDWLKDIDVRISQLQRQVTTTTTTKPLPTPTKG
jgi:phenolic acid decarboxylase